MDLKNYVVLDRQKIAQSLQSESGLEKLNCLFNAGGADSPVDFWYKQFSYDENRSALENFLLYRAANAFKLYTAINDADMTAPALAYLKTKLLAIPEVKSVLVGKEIHAKEKMRAFQVELTDGEIIFLESDTAHSLMGDLGSYMRKVIWKLEKLSQSKGWPQKTYIQRFNLTTKHYEPFKLFYFYTLMARIKAEIVQGEELAQFEALEERAQQVHTVSNMCLVPYGYNSKRGFRLSTYTSNNKINDCWDLTLLDFQEMCDDSTFTTEQLQQRLNNKKCTLRSIQFLLAHQALLGPQSVPTVINK